MNKLMLRSVWRSEPQRFAGDQPAVPLYIHSGVKNDGLLIHWFSFKLTSQIINIYEYKEKINWIRSIKKPIK